ncbi:MAG: TolC family protein [Verrucomicrobiales bacterium]|nr:TolC family protein [Verrucomicrobiales bacterium]
MKISPSYPTASSLAFVGASLAVATLLSSCQLPGQLDHADSNGSFTGPINDPANVLDESYEPKSQDERDLEARIVENGEAFLTDSARTYAREGESAVAASFAHSGGVPKEAWWTSSPSRPLLNGDGKTAHLGLDEIYQRTLAHSSQVRVFASLPLIRETAIGEAEGAFDPELFSQARYDSTHEPTGTVLETGNPNDFFRETGWTYEGGVRKRFLPGTSVSVTQELNQKENNSEFFIPGNQGRANLKLSVMQPLLRGAGIKYNRTMMQIAKLDAETGYDEFIRQLETHLMEVNRSYWALYLGRAVYLDKQRLVSETQSVVDELSKRGNLDAMASQMSRARSALATRKSDIVRSELAIKNAESRLRALINDPWFIESGISEIVPADMPVAAPVAPDFGHSVAEALTFRPEIKQAENHLLASSLREGMAKNEKLPTVNAIGEIGISALRGEGDVGGAYRGQYDDGVPTWGVGLIASMPLERRAAKAVHLRTQLEMRQKQDQLRSTMDTVLLEVQIAHREVMTAWPDAKAKWEASKAADQELEVLKSRRGVDADAGETSTSLYLEKLLDSQERGAYAREEFLRSLVVYNSALTNLDRAKGTLLQQEEVGIDRTKDDQNLPIIRLAKEAAAQKAEASYEIQK